jgi:4-amino-4-deoxychorismate lyase
MRAAVIKSAAELAIPVKEKDLTLADLELADEVFLTNSLIGIWPVTELDGSDCYWEHGELTRHLQSELKTTER